MQTYRDIRRVIFQALVAAVILLAAGFISQAVGLGNENARATARNGITAFSTGLRAYYVEYGKFLQGDNATLTRVLRGDNPRKIIFVNLPASFFDDRGEFIDPWGHPYRFDLQNPKGPRIWSLGPKGIDAPNDPNSGDVCSWRQAGGS